ncbi:hypothetical protein [Echinicola vietnamensis]|uniref:Uncharacterized protein n=1 Tax=Echinicola vietnamensis (strain DSM 17526 / LMG 23754 / KMM 6221) TaxID=926556 RepID=L0G0E1_ECHVK|nr:hypothetical protein [Echinicola vietnamensis]AGA78476.1 hypothetical protein Echvi_2226 [Echinicola vietnamensis DSM 17526]
MKELSFERMERVKGGARGDFGCGLAAAGYIAGVGLLLAFPPAGIGAALFSSLIVTGGGMMSVGYSCGNKVKNGLRDYN